LVRSWRLPDSERWARAELLPDGDLLVIGADRPAEPVQGIPDDARYLARLRWSGELLWKRRLPAHHDVEQQPDGRLLLLTLKRRRVPRFDPAFDVRDDQLSLLDADGEIVEEVSLLDAFAKSPELHDLSVFGPNTLGVVPWIDPFHANSVEWLRRPELAGRHPIFGPGHVLIASRHQSIVAVVSWEKRRLVWAWGRGELLGPHDARALDNGHLLIFDNGLGRGWSRVLELDPVRGVPVWEYRATPPEDFYTATKGSSQRLANGNTLIADSDNGRAFEVTHDGEVVWDFLCPHEVGSRRRAAIVRAVRFPPAFIEAIGSPR
jgi:outer membrane protein assembly factor BamB